MKRVFEGSNIDILTNEEFREALNKYDIDTNYLKLKNIEDFYNYCVEFREHCWYKVYNIELDVTNKKICWIGLIEKENTIGDSATLYHNPNLKRSILCDVMTFAEASEKWGLGESTLRSAIHSDRFIEGVDYKKSGKVWLVTRKAMERVYGKREV